MTERYFTVAEANALLKQVRPLVEQMVEYRRELGAALEQRERLGEVTGSNGGGFHPRVPGQVDTAVNEAADGIKRCVEELTALGIQVKDIDTGLVDYPSWRDDEEVLLCWRLGEGEIAWWHTLDGGFAGRQPL
ncbi:MAG TPA: DUF2203 domain-containing protein [Gaiellaceae bacterium]|nr:DUF2203 domain-containing protein [Gaiellaceae bacterium]